MQSGAINSSSKASQRAQEEARVIGNQNLINVQNAGTNALNSSHDLAAGQFVDANDASTRYLANGAIAAGGALGTGYGAANERLADAGSRATDYLNAGRTDIGAGVTNANALLQPYIDTGSRALDVVGDLSGANGVEAGRAALGNFQASPAYAWNLEQGLRGVDAGASARGMLVSGSGKAAEMRYASGLASNEFTNYYNRLSGLAGQGLTASTTAGGNMTRGGEALAGVDRALAQNVITQGAGMAQNDIGLGTGLANINTGLGTALSNNEMTTGGRLGQNDIGLGTGISNLLTNNVNSTNALNTNAANNQAQTIASTGSALASIYGGVSQGIGNAVNQGLNNYTYMNALAPKTNADGTGAANTAYNAGGYGGTLGAPTGYGYGGYTGYGPYV